MAIVFISPQEKQRVFFRGVAIFAVLLLFIISLLIFLPGFVNKTSNTSTGVSSSNPNITINLSIMDSDKIKNLEPFNEEIGSVFIYTVQDKNGRKTTGNISAATKEQAQSLLEQSGFKVLSLEEMSVGRNDPFISY